MRHEREVKQLWSEVLTKVPPHPTNHNRAGKFDLNILIPIIL